MKPTALITGARGLLGRALARRLGRGAADYSSRLGPDGVAALVRVLRRRRPRRVFHCAGTTRPGPWKRLQAAHLLSTACLLEAVAQAGRPYPRIVVVGSASEYGPVPPSRQPIRETQPARPRTEYGMSKALQTSLALAYAERGIPVLVARVFNLIDRGLPASFSITDFRRAIARARRRPRAAVRLGNLSTVRDFLTLPDAVEALDKLGRKGRPGEIYNVCSGRGVPLRRIWEAMADGRAIKVRQGKAALRSDIDRSVGDPGKIRRHTGWRAAADPVEEARRLAHLPL